MDTEPIGVTGVTGAVGGRVAQLLADRGLALRLVARDPGRVPRFPGADVRQAAYGQGDSMEEALRGTRTVLMVSAAESEARRAEHFSFIDAAVRAGVEHVVYTSFQGASPDAVFTLSRDHWATEEHIRSSGLRWTVLQDSFYADFLAGLAGEDGTIAGPAGDGRVAAVARTDVARVAATVLAGPEEHRDVTHVLTGPAALTLSEVARTITATTGRETRFVDQSVAEAYESRRRHGAPPWQLDAWVSTYTAIRDGELAQVTTSVQDITGGAPLTLPALLRSSRR